MSMKSANNDMLEFKQDNNVMTSNKFFKSLVVEMLNNIFFKNDDILIKRDNGKMVIEYDGDLYLKINGEFGIQTTNEYMCFDTINSNLMLNCRASKDLKDTEEAKIFNEKMTKQREKNNNKVEQIPLYIKEIMELKERTMLLERKIEELEKK